jgi:hypothetical protein
MKLSFSVHKGSSVRRNIEEIATTKNLPKRASYEIGYSRGPVYDIQTSSQIEGDNRSTSI